MNKLIKGKIAISIKDPKKYVKVRPILISEIEQYECHAIFCDKTKKLKALIQV